MEHTSIWCWWLALHLVTSRRPFHVIAFVLSGTLDDLGMCLSPFCAFPSFPFLFLLWFLIVKCGLLMFTGSYRYACGWWRFPSWPSNKEVSKRTASTLDLLRTSEDRLLEFSAPTTHWMASTDCVYGLHICFNTFIKILLLLGSPDTSSTHLNATSMIQCDPIQSCILRCACGVSVYGCDKRLADPERHDTSIPMCFARCLSVKSLIWPT